MGGDAADDLRLDVSCGESWGAAVDRCVERFGRIDILVNNAGVGGGGALETTSDDQWERQIAVNLGGVFYGMRACIPRMAAAGGGSVINISSIHGVRGKIGRASCRERVCQYV